MGNVTPASYAVDLAELGFRVLPLDGKVPALTDWPTRATAKPTDVRKLFRRMPQANVGIATGRGIFVLDVDPGRGGNESLASLPELPVTLTARTGGGGWHYYFRAPAGRRVANSRDRLGKGLDVRGDGGQVVAPPSRHPSGGVYTWAEGRSPKDVQISEAPAWLLERLGDATTREPAPRGAPPPDPSQAYRRAERYLECMPAAISGSGGHDATFRAALALTRGFCLPESEAFELLARVYNPKCEPPWSERELRHKVESAANHGQVEWGYLLLQRSSGCESRESMTVAEPAALAKRSGSSMSPEPSEARPAAPSGGFPSGLIPITKSYASIVQILRVPELRERVFGSDAGELEYDEQALIPCIRREPIREEGIGRIRELCERTFRDNKGRGIEFAREKIEMALLQVAKEKPFHPVREYLQNLPEWDQISRIELIADRVLGVDLDAQPLAPRLIRMWLISAVARALNPGCKVDTVLVLTGVQGAHKSQFLQAMVPEPRFFTDTPIEIGSKDGYLNIRTAWLVEWPEMETTRGKDVRAVKAFITSATDTFRPPYERTARQFPRSCVFVATTNDDDFLNDPTGNRRFWPVEVGPRIDIDTVAVWRDQIWAEALHAYRSGERWWIQDQRETMALLDTQRSYQRTDVWEEIVVEWASGRTAAFSVVEVLEQAVGKERAQCTDHDKKRVVSILKRNGFQQGKTRGYERSSDGRVTRSRLWEPLPPKQQRLGGVL